MMAHSFHKPLLTEDCVEREITAIDNEWKMNSQDDTVRMFQILQSNTKDPDHIFN